MTREEAITILNMVETHGSLVIQAKEMAIQALSQEPCDDAISRQAVLDQTYLWSKDEFLRVTNPFDYLRKRINSLQPVIPQPKTGHWITEDMFDGDVAYRCSECNELFWIESGTPKDNEYNFCPKCGKRLVEPQESEEV